MRRRIHVICGQDSELAHTQQNMRRRIHVICGQDSELAHAQQD